MFGGKVMKLNCGIDKKDIDKISQYFTKPNKCSGGNIKVRLYLSNYATEADLKGAPAVDTSNVAANSDLASLKADIDE